MMKYVLLFIAISVIISCGKGDDLPECIQTKIDLLKNKDLRTVKKVKINGEDMFWFNTGAIEYDGAEHIYNESCDAICFYCGFCIEPECIKDFPGYNSSEWEVVWKK